MFKLCNIRSSLGYIYIATIKEFLTREEAVEHRKQIEKPSRDYDKQWKETREKNYKKCMDWWVRNTSNILPKVKELNCWLYENDVQNAKRSYRIKEPVPQMEYVNVPDPYYSDLSNFGLHIVNDHQFESFVIEMRKKHYREIKVLL